jgi:RimJ/RimL family protein N-acetyltransferase
VTRRSITFRPLCCDDFPLLQRWLQNPHISAWWRELLDLDAVRAKYAPRVDGIEPTHVFLIEYCNRPVGWIQWYRWSDYPDHAQRLGAEPDSAGLDLAIGEQKMMGMGLGPSAIGKFLHEVVFVDTTIAAVISDPEEKNTRSVRAFEKAGFTEVKTVKLRGETCERSVMRLSSPAHIHS